VETPRIALVAREPDSRQAIAAAFGGAPATWDVTLHVEAPEADMVVAAPEVAVEGAVPFDPRNPTRAVDEVNKRLAASSREGAFIVTSASGGSGATTVALHLAAVLSERGGTCFVDLDPRAGAAPRLGVLDSQHKTWAEAGKGPDELRLAALPMPGGFRALLSPSGAPEVPSGLLRRTLRSFEYVVVDLPPERLRKVSNMALAAVLVVPGTVPGVCRAQRLLADGLAGRLAIVLNRTGYGGGLTRSEASRRLGRSVPLELPCTPALRDAEDEGRLLDCHWTRFARRIRSLALSLEKA
jgi:Flp pilus assembly CpaE family ATPase